MGNRRERYGTHQSRRWYLRREMGMVRLARDTASESVSFLESATLSMQWAIPRNLMPSRRSARWTDGWRCRARALLAHARGVDVAFAIERERGDLFLGSAVENEAIARRRNAIHEAAAIGAGNNVSLSVEREHPDVRVIALEEKGVLAFGSHFVNLAMIAGGDVKVAGLVEREIPDVLGAGREILGRTPRGIQGRLG